MFSVLGKLAWFFKKHWKRYSVAVALLMVVNIFEVLPPYLVGAAIDDIQMNTLTWDGLVKYLVYLAVIAVLTYLSTYIWMYQLFGGAYILERHMRSTLMSHFLRMTPTFYEKNRTGDLMALATNDLKAVSITAGFGILTLVDSTLFMITILATMSILISWKLTLAAILPLPIMAVLMKIYGAKIHTRFMEAQDKFGELNDRVLESVAGVRVIRAYVQERADEKKFKDMTEEVFQKNISVAKIDALFDPTIKVVVGLSFIIGLGYGSYLVFNNQLTLGALVSFNVYLGMLIWPMFAIGELINIMQRGNASLDRVDSNLAYEEDVKDPVEPRETNKLGTITFDSTTFQYPTSNVKNLEDVYVSILAGQTLGIVGKTGSGKTTFLKQLLREYPNGEGTISISDVDITLQTKDHVRSKIGYVPQDHVLFSRSVRENILFGYENATENELEHAIRLAAFDKDLTILPEGLETLVGEKGVALSGGQKQRISIARAMVLNPDILILDDSLSAVDAKTETRIIENIQRERKGKTTLITTHRLSAVEHADQIIVLDQGKVIQKGSHEELIAVPGWYQEQFVRQQIERNVEEEVQV